ncbi:MAG TPA: hypothetical protein VG294_00920 [Solirubrobacteraceae bacterium]|nr:hypothetical protein [Solirubrobacteraceae bacterium]
MRVIVASGVLVLGVALLAVLSPSAAAASTGHSTPSYVCPGIATPPCCSPITPTPASVVSCCPVPTIGGCCNPANATTCCTTTSCPAGLTIVVNPSTVSEGSATTVSGTLTGATVAAQTIDLFEEAAGQSTFTDVAQTQTSATGTYRFVPAVLTNAQWYTKAPAIQSPTVTESVLAAVTLHPSSTRPKAGSKFLLSGTIAPSHAGEQVALQRLRSGGWATVAQARLDAQSRFAITEKMRAYARARFRVVLAADTRNARSVSAAVSITAR